GGDVELFGTRARPAFDELGAARTLAQMIVDGALQRDRAARLVQQPLHDRQAVTLQEAMDSLVAATWKQTAATTKGAALVRVSQRALADRLLALAADREASPEVRAIVERELAALRRVASSRAAAGAGDAQA